jgi:hypothetical protein
MKIMNKRTLIKFWIQKYKIEKMKKLSKKIELTKKKEIMRKT